MSAAAGDLIARLGSLEATVGEVKRWLAGPHCTPLADADRTRLTAMAEDVERRLRQWQTNPGMLVVVLLGGTGVGKSTLLNALAGSAVASAGLMRPTTQTATLYHHADAPLDKLDPKLRECRAVAHRREALRHKILIDTPDVDGSVVEHHERLRAVLPLADAVLYVGSQEKYHDREAWKLLLEHGGARGFAFVLNKWDRCQTSAGDRDGAAPDVDFRRSLRKAGFDDPLLFRTAAGQWALRRLHDREPDDPVPDDFEKLEHWLESGLHARAIATIKLSGLAGKLDRLAHGLEDALPADFGPRAPTLSAAWDAALRECVREQTQALLEAADRNVQGFDAHFRSLDRRDYTGVFGWYLTIAELASRIQWSLRPSFAPPSLEALTGKQQGALADWSRRTLAETPEIVRDHQRDDVRRRLLAAADRAGWPMTALESYLPGDSQNESDADLFHALLDEADAVERDLRTPGSPQYTLRRAFRFAAAWLPWAVFLAVMGQWVWNVLFHQGALVTLTPISLALLLMLLVLMALHFVLHRFLPTEWRQLRGRFARGLEVRLYRRLAPPYLAALQSFVEAAAKERTAIGAPLGELRKMAAEIGESHSANAERALFSRTG